MTRSLALSILAAAALAGCAGATEYYAHWWCTGSQCASVMGGYDGTAGPFSSSAECEQWRQTYILTSTCDTSATATSGDPPAACTNPTLTGLTLSPQYASISSGTTKQLTATASYSCGPTQDVSTVATWGLTNIQEPVVATVSGSGLVTAGVPGTQGIRASLGAYTATASVNVTAAVLQSIAVTPTNPSVAQGATQQLVATGTRSDGSTFDATSQVTWTSSVPACAKVSISGLATGVSQCASTVTATLSGISGSTVVTVVAPALRSVTVAPASAYLALGFALQFTATATYTDGSTADVTASATWSSDTPAVATVAGGGLATSVGAGDTLVTGTFGGLFQVVRLTVTTATLQSLSIDPPNPSIAPGTTLRFSAIGHFSDGNSQVVPTGVAWTSGATSVATIAQTGVATGVALGTAPITAVVGAFTAGTTLTVTWTGIRWTAVTSPLGSQPLRAVTWAGTQFVAVGAGGAILTSPDGAAWTARTSGTASDLAGVTWGSGQLVAVGAGGTILTSPDGITWTSRTSGVTSNLAGVAWSGARMVAVGDAGTVLTSPDGIAWTAQTSGTTANLGGIASSGTALSAVGAAMLASPDGLAWTVPVPSASTLAVTWAGAQFVAVGGSSRWLRGIGVPPTLVTTGVVETSPDGIVWTPGSSGTSEYLTGVAASPAQVVAVGKAGGVLTSADGVVWTSRTSGTTQPLAGIATSGARFVAVGDGGVILVSP